MAFVDSYDETGTIKERQDIPPFRGSRPTTSALEVRNIIKSYGNCMEGFVPWQWDHVRSRIDILANENS